MCDYKIYKLYSKKNPDKLYIGSTKNNLKYRLNGHRSNYKSGRLSGKLNNLFSNDDVVIDLIENILKCSKEDARIREDYYIDKFGFYNSNCSSKELSIQKTKKKQKEWRDNNKEKLKEYKKEYNDKNKDYYKEYRDKNREKLNIYKNEWNKKNKKKHLDAMELLLK